MAVLGTIRFRVTHQPDLLAYGERALGGVPAVMQRSEARVYESVRAHTPVDTGHMQANLLKTSDIAEVTDTYQVFWRDQEFTGQINPRGRQITAFYPAILILGGAERAPKYPSLLTSELEAERPVLIRDLRDHFQRSH